MVITLTVPAVGPVTDTMHVTATSVISPAFYAVVTDTTIVTGPVPMAGVDIEEDESGSGLAGTQVVYQHTVTNTGNIADTFLLTYASSQGWTVVVTPMSVTLAAAESASVQVTVDIPAGTSPGVMDTTLITATSTADPAVFDSVTDTTTVVVTSTAGVEIGPNQNGNAAAGDTIVYQYTVTNTGTSPDTIALTVSSSQGWTVEVAPLSVTVAAGLTAPVVVTLSVPGGATQGIVDVTTVTATSGNDPAVFDIATATTLVLGSGPGVIIAPNRDGSGAPGTDVVYTHWVTNTGNVTDTFNFNPSSDQGWTVSVPSPLTLGAGATSQIEVTVSIPTDAVSGTVDTTLIFASSLTDPTAVDVVTDTTTVTAGVPSGDLFLPVLFTTCTPTGVDLVVTAIEIVPANPQAGQTVTVRVTIRNQGTVDVSPLNNFYLDFYDNQIPAPNTPGQIEWGIQGSWMTAGASRTLSASYTFIAGTHQLYAQVDTDRFVDECPNEYNNILGPIALTVPGAANAPIPVLTPIAPQPLDVPRPTPTPGAPGEQEGTQLESSDGDVTITQPEQ